MSRCREIRVRVKAGPPGISICSNFVNVWHTFNFGNFGEGSAMPKLNVHPNLMPIQMLDWFLLKHSKQTLLDY